MADPSLSSLVNVMSASRAGVVGNPNQGKPSTVGELAAILGGWPSNQPGIPAYSHGLPANFLDPHMSRQKIATTGLPGGGNNTNITAPVTQNPSAPLPGTPYNPQLPTPQERLIESGLPANHGGRLPIASQRPPTGGTEPQQYVPPGWTTATYNGVTGAVPTPSTNNVQTVDSAGNRAGPPPPANTSSAQDFIKSFKFQNAAPGSDAAKFNAVLQKYGANDAMNLLLNGGLWNTLGSQYQNAANDAGMSRDDIARIINSFSAGGGNYLGDDYGFNAGKYSWGLGGRNIPGLTY